MKKRLPTEEICSEPLVIYFKPGTRARLKKAADERLTNVSSMLKTLILNDLASHEARKNGIAVAPV